MNICQFGIRAWLIGSCTASCLATSNGPDSSVAGPNSKPVQVEAENLPVPRTADPDPKAVQDSLNAVIRLPVVQLTREAMTSRGSTFRDFVVFSAEGIDYCHAYLSAEECDSEVGVTWAMRDVFGVAIIEYETPLAPRVGRFRFMGSSSLIPASSERRGQSFDVSSRVGEFSHVALEVLEVADVDDDGDSEYVVVVTHDSLSSDPEGGPDAVFEWFFHRRFLVFRDDLTLEADGYVQQTWGRGGPGWSFDHDFVREMVRFQQPTDTSAGAIVVEWCEVDATFDECSLDILCDKPTERVTVGYDAVGDNYPTPRRKTLRRADDESEAACGD